MAKVKMVGRRRRLGKTFTVNSRTARVLEAIGAAARVVRTAPEQKASQPAPAEGPAQGPAPTAEPDLTALRAEYKALFGRAAYASWDAAELQEKIAARKAAD
jgi:hypothetical protein